MDYKKYFKNKKITVMGLGLLGRGLKDTIFLAENGADLVVTDLKPATALKSSLAQLRKFKKIKYVLGKHDTADFENKDFILKAAGVPDDSVFLEHARKKGIPIEMDASLFARLTSPSASVDGGLAKLARKVKVIGVTGTRGKTTTATLVFEIIKAFLKNKSQKVYLAGNVRDGATLPLLSKVKSGDIVILELDSWQLQGFGESKISPNISVFTNFYPDHLNYYKGDMDKYFSDKTNIFKFQKKDDVAVVGEMVAGMIPGKKIIAKKMDVPSYWKIKIIGEHNKENISCAIAVAKSLKIPEKIIQKVVENFTGVEGRLQLLRTLNGINIWNDNNSTTPTATIVALRALRASESRFMNHDSGKIRNKRIVLVCGGSDKKLDLSELISEVNKSCSTVILLPGFGSEKLKALSSKLKAKTIEVTNLKSAINQALKLAGKDDVVLFSPAFASFGLFKNEYDRNDQFVSIVKKLK